MTTEEAIVFNNEQRWLPMTDFERAEIVLREDKLCMPYVVFVLALQRVLERPVFTHEIGLRPSELLAELDQKRRS